MAVIKNKTTEGNRNFWSHVESISEQARRDGGHRQVRANASGSFSALRDDTVISPCEPEERDGVTMIQREA